MVGQLHTVDLPPEVFARGFWLYVWKIVGPSGKRFCYVGMTGDVTGVAQSPFARGGGHFGSNKTVNQIRRYLEDPHGLKPEECQSFNMVRYFLMNIDRADSRNIHLSRKTENGLLYLRGD